MNNPANAIQWAIGLELALHIYDPWKVYMTTDHPNGGPFIYYPKVISWLMSRKARTDLMREMNKAVLRRTTLANIYREYSFGEIATVTRAATAKALGLNDKGHLGPGADGDVSIYDIDPTTWRPSMYEALEKALGHAAYTIKGGEVVVKDGEVVATPLGDTYWVDSKVPEDLEADVMKEIEADFNDYYTVSIKNYPVQDAYLPTGRAMAVEGRWAS
jgi:formylmethanofuran dehydrogenase subunit A